MAAGDLALRGYMGDEMAASIMRDAWLSAGWIASERMLRLPLLAGSDPDDASTVAAVLSLTPILPPGFARHIDVDGTMVRPRAACYVPRCARPYRKSTTGVAAGNAPVMPALT